ncbi:MAG: carboxylating nicotinate-nucleotide diphosphorylase [Candidatus Natronoplasma sp.]
MNEHRVKKIVERAVDEDLGTGDITTESVVDKEDTSHGKIIFKENGVLAGLPVAEMVFHEIDQSLDFNALREEGSEVDVGETVAKLSGKTRSILKGERLALNFLQRMSGIATNTREYVNEVEEYDVKVVDTRKTTPNLRILEKYAVRTGGGTNHRMGLYDCILIKDNHIRSIGSIEEAVEKAKKHYPVKIEVEVESMEGVKEAVDASADIIMLDNMSIGKMKEAVEFIGDKAVIEASGGIDLNNIESVAGTGVNIISVGALTHHIRSLDISLDLVR